MKYKHSARRSFRIVCAASLLSVACNSSALGDRNGGAGDLGEQAGEGGGGGVNRQHLPTLISPGVYEFSTTEATPGSGALGGTSGAAPGGQSDANGAPTGPVCVLNFPPGPAPVTALCGDGFRTGFEECDDGNLLDGDSCNADCKVTASLVAPRVAPSGPLPLPSRELGTSRHPMAAGCNTVGVSVIERATGPAALKLASFSRIGVAGPIIQYGSANVDMAAPAVAAFPDDTFAVAWTDFDGDGDEQGVQLRKIDPAATTQAPAIFANSKREFSQHDPDAIFDGNELVVAWVDDSDPETAPDLRYRIFGQDLKPKTADQTLAATSEVEGDIALAAFNGAWAAAWRSGSAGNETIEVKSGGVHWTVGPFLPGGVDDRPALAFVDATHLAVAFTEGTDPSSSGTANVPRLYAAVLDAAYPGPTLAFPIAPTAAPYATDASLSQSEPALTRFSDRLLLAWRSAAVSGDVLGDELWSRVVKWTVQTDGTVQIDTSAGDLPLLNAAALRNGDQNTPALLSSDSWPDRHVVTAWQDFGKSFGATSGDADIGLQFSEAPALDTSLLWVTSWLYTNETFAYSPEQRATAGLNTSDPSVVFTSPVPAATSDPGEVAFTPSGDMWTASCTGFLEPQYLMKFSASKVAASNSPAEDVRITLPLPDSSYNCAVALTVNAAGDIYVATLDLRDSRTSHLFHFGASQLTQSGAPVPEATLSSSTYFNGIWDIALDSMDNLYVASYLDGHVVRFSPGELAADDAAVVPDVVLNVPGADGLVFGPHGDLWVADYDNATLVEIAAEDLTASGTPTPQVTVAGAPQAVELAFDRHGNLWAPSWADNLVRGFAAADLTTSGTKTPFVMLSGNGAPQVPTSVRFSPDR